ncbi:MAG: hypothetical protein HYY13_04665 [Nitrospirae bacterium]|nr:hypothetical protein [Nitrospirota bacterium]
MSRKSVGRGAAILLAAALGPAMVSCSSSTSSPALPTDPAREYLAKGYHRQAAVEFSRAAEQLPAGAQRCEARYGLGLSLLFSVGADLLTSVDGLLADDDDADELAGLFLDDEEDSDAPRRRGREAPHRVGLPADQRGDTDTVVANILDPYMEQVFRPAEEALEEAAAGGCRFRTGQEGIQVDTGLESRVWIGTDFGPTEASLLAGMLKAMRGAYMFATAYDVGFDLYGMEDLLFDAEETTDWIGAMRLMGRVMTDAPAFLGWSSARAGRFGEAGALVSKGLDLVGDGTESLYSGSEGEAARDNVIGYVDANGNGRADSGDELWLGILKADPPLTIGEETLSRYPIQVSRGDLGSVAALLVWSVAGDPYNRAAVGILRRLAGALRGQGDLLNLAELNAAVPFGFSLFPKTLVLDLARVLPADRSLAKPLRELLPAWGTYDPPGGEGRYAGDAHSIFLVEGELPKASPVSDLVQEVAANDATKYCHTCGPGLRFSAPYYTQEVASFSLGPEVAARLGGGVSALPDDCVEPTVAPEDPALGKKLAVPYLYWQDPTFNGSVFVNLTPITAEGCGATDAPFLGPDPGANPVPRASAVPASRYSLDKALASFFKDAVTLFGAVQQTLGASMGEKGLRGSR